MPPQRVGRGIGAADDDGARPPPVGNWGTILGGDHLAVGADSIDRGIARLIDVVLDGDGDAVQPANRVASPERLVGIIRFAEGFIAPNDDHRVDRRVDLVQPLQRRRHGFPGGDLTIPDRRHQGRGIPAPQRLGHLGCE